MNQAATIASTRDLRRFLLDRMVATAAGTEDVATAKAICNYAQQVYNTVNIETKVAAARAHLNGESIPPVVFDGGDDE